jgi:ribosome-associated protein
MDIRKLQRAIVDGLEDVKAQNIVVFNTEHLSPLFERVIIASGTSNRQTKALASSVRETVKGRGLQVMRTEGEDNGEWIIVDCGAAVVHVMQPTIRDYYRLEEIWGGKPVNIKLGSSEVKLVKATEEPAPAPAKVARKATAAKPITAKAAPKPAAPKPGANRAVPSAAAKKAVAKKAAVGTQAPKKGVTRSVGVKTAAPAAPVKTLKVGAGQGVGKAAAAKRAAPAKTAPKTAAKPAAKPAAKAAPRAAAKTAGRAKKA